MRHPRVGVDRRHPYEEQSKQTPHVRTADGALPALPRGGRWWDLHGHARPAP